MYLPLMQMHSFQKKLLKDLHDLRMKRAKVGAFHRTINHHQQLAGVTRPTGSAQCCQPSSSD